MYRKSVGVLLVLTCLALVGCGKKDDEVNAFINDLNTFTDELVKKVESGPNPSAGADEAQKYFDSKKADIQSKLDSVKKIGEKQVSEETKKKLTDGLYNNGMKIGKMTAKYSADPAAGPKVQKITQDYMALLR
ncbi:MAG: hypothetical protein ICV68_05190 [Pyrinomonadaceae bacterium]|nr:hypothetical protein [Pyrinomonadaceae bacterium]